MDDDEERGPPPPPLLDRLEALYFQAGQRGRVITEFAVCPLTWLDLCEELCPTARALTDIESVRWRGIPVKKNLHPRGEEDVVYFAHVAATPPDKAVQPKGPKA